LRFTAERYSPEAAGGLGQEVVGLYHRFAYMLAANMLSPGARVLDLGFGDGYGSQILRDAGLDYVGIEVDPAAVAQARERYEGDFRLYDGVTLPNERYDLVTCFQVIEHLAEPERLLEQVAARGDEAVFTTPNRDLRLRPDERPWNRFHMQEFSRSQLETLLARFFRGVDVSFIRASPEIEATELARIRRARKLARLDVLGIRYRLPERLDVQLRRRLRPPAPGPSLGLSVDRLWLDGEQGLDLFARAQSSASPTAH
jgi:protein-L-isoaspartate O-methyltransferase